MKYILTVIWESGEPEKQEYPYDTYDKAKQGQQNMSMCFGKQISYSFITEKPENLRENIRQWNAAIEKKGYIN